MSRDYPHIGDTSFPDLDTVNAYKYENEYDYSKYTNSVKIKMLNVSWCSDYENVVYFESKDARDSWFDSQDGLVKEMSSMFRLYNDGSVKVDIPIDECMQYNYVMIDYGKLPQQTVATKDSKMFYFISGINQASVNATELFLSVDYWTSYINDMNVQYVNLMRGHWPMKQTSVTNYLANPIENSEYLLTDDVNYGDFNRVASSEDIIFNDSVATMYLGFLTNGNVHTDDEQYWNAKTYTNPYYNAQAFSSVDSFVISVDDWANFRTAITNSCPQFWQTVKGMFIISGKLLSFSVEFYFFGIACHYIRTNSDVNQGTFTINKEKFGYSGKLAEIAKLYTYPYAALEVNDIKGGTTIVKIEDTVGSLNVHTIMCDMYPFLNIESYILGIGTSTNRTLTFKNVYNNTVSIGGRYYDFTTKWSIPVFAVQLTAENDWTLNGLINADAVLNNALDLANVTYDNTITMADVANANNIRNATCTTDNAALNIAANNSNTSLSNEQIGSVSGWDVTLNSSNTDQSIAGTRATVNLSIEAANAQASVQNTATYEKAGAQAAVSVVQGAISGADGGALGVAAGALSGGVTAAAGMFTAAVDANANLQGVSINNGLMSDTAELNINYTNAARINQNTYTTQMATLKENLNTNLNAVHNTYIAGSSKNAADTLKANSSASRTGTGTTAALSKELIAGGTTYDGNARRTFNASNYQTRIHNHPQFGQQTGTPDIIDKPFGLSCSIITQSKNAIRQAGEQFMRYGYMFNMEVNISSFNVMPVFTYWQCDKVYCNDRGVFGGAQDVIKSILNKGTTVWREDYAHQIGTVSIYDNIEVS